MKIRQLRAFVTVAGTLNFRRAAEILFMTQPPLSHAIKALEEELGVVLLNREKKRNIYLTPAGESFLQAAERILQDVERAKQTAQLVDRGDFGSLTIVYTDDFVYGVLPDLLNSFNLQHPNTLLFANLSWSFRMMNKLNRNEADCIFTTQPLQKIPLDLKSVPWPPTPIVVIVPSSHPLARRSEINLKELAKEHFLMLSQNMRSRFDERVNSLFINAGITLRETLEIMDTALCAEMVRRGYGIGLATRESIPPQQKGISLLRIKNRGTALNRVMIWRRQNDNSSLQRFIEMALEYTEGGPDQEVAINKKRP